MREHPAIKIRRQFALVKHVATGPVVARRLDSRGAHNFVIGKHAFGVACAGHRLACDFRPCAVGTNDAAGADPGSKSARLFASRACFEMHHSHAVWVALNALKSTNAAYRSAGGGALAQPFVKFFTVDHAHKAVVDRNVDLVVFGRDHAG